MASLSLFATHPDGRQTEHLLVDGLRVGRGHDCEVCVRSAFLSRVHFVVRATEEGFAIEDQHRHTASSSGMGAILGTYLNDEKALGRRAIAAGDRISPAANPTDEHPVFVVNPTVDPTPPPPPPKKPWWRFW